MNARWLRGLLLGMTLALLLSGGAALAASLSLTVDQECFECWPGDNEDPEYLVEVTVDGYELEDDMRGSLRIDGTVLDSGAFPPSEGPPCHFMLYVPCETFEPEFWSDCYGNSMSAGAFGDATAQQNGPVVVDYGEFAMRIWNLDTSDSARVTWRFAEDCEAVEFVPEPGTIALLGTGLLSLAGYAGLRLKTRD
jgi:hypothetical protein